jgi:hypothetical protein
MASGGVRAKQLARQQIWEVLFVVKGGKICKHVGGEDRVKVLVRKFEALEDIGDVGLDGFERGVFGRKFFREKGVSLFHLLNHFPAWFVLVA